MAPRAVVSLRLDAKLVAVLDERAAQLEVTRAALIEEVLTRFLSGQLVPASPEPKTPLVALEPHFRGREP